VKSSVKRSVSVRHAAASSSASVNPLSLPEKSRHGSPGGFFHGPSHGFPGLWAPLAALMQPLATL
jgi:hypothetical protein